ncbi:MAG TPA: hypothetical protein VFS00_17630 [Polyangiaceae bacterium]|nr:hypothetical protein [Polyangiaceae bacterium]
MTAFTKDPNHWLFRLSADEWIRAALGELGAAERALRGRQAKAGHVGVLRAAGMALNGALIVEPNPAWGRSYVEHVAALAREGDAVPAAVREAARFLIEAPAPGSSLVPLRSPAGDERLLEAARTIMAHAYARVKRRAPLEEAPEAGPAGEAPAPAPTPAERDS